MKKSEVVKVAKQGAAIVLSLGCGIIVGNAVKMVSPSTLSKIGKTCVGATSLILSGMLGDKATAYTEEKIDEFAADIEEVFINAEESTDECCTTEA